MQRAPTIITTPATISVAMTIAATTPALILEDEQSVPVQFCVSATRRKIKYGNKQKQVREREPRKICEIETWAVES